MNQKTKNTASLLFNQLWRKPSRAARRHLRVLYFGLMSFVAPTRFPDCGGGFESSGVFVSILLPSRGRAEMLRKTLANISQTAGKESSRVEVLVRLDDDDAESQAATESLHAACAPVALTVVTGPRSGGYKTFHLFINELAARARGDFLMLFNDDARFMTNEWPRFFERRREQLAVLKFKTPGFGNLNIFPATHRKAVEVIGHYSLDAHCDSWVEVISRKVGIEREVAEIEIDHFRDTSEETDDQTRAETSAAYAETRPAFHQKRGLQNKDIARLSAHIFRHGYTVQIKQQGEQK